MKKCLSGSLKKGEKLSEAYYFFSVFKLFLINVLFISVCLARHFRTRFEPRYFKCSDSYNFIILFRFFPGYSYAEQRISDQKNTKRTLPSYWLISLFTVKIKTKLPQTEKSISTLLNLDSSVRFNNTRLAYHKGNIPLHSLFSLL